MTTPPAPVYLVKGDDATLVAGALAELLAELTGGDPFSAEDLSGTGDDIDVGTVVDACLTPPFLAERRVVVVRDVGRLPAAEAETLVAYLARPMETSTLVLVGNVPGNTKLGRAIAKVGRVLDTKLEAKGRPQWVRDRIREGPVTLDRAAAEALADHLGEDVARLPSLLQALALSYGDGATIGQEELAPFLGDAGGVAPWDLTDAIDGRDTGRALEQLHRMLDGGQRHPMVVLSTLHRHYANVLRLEGSGVRSDSGAAGLIGVAPYPAGKAMRQAQKLGFAGVARAIELLAEADLALRGQGWPGEADRLILEVLVARLSRLGGGSPSRR